MRQLELYCLSILVGVPQRLDFWWSLPGSHMQCFRKVLTRIVYVVSQGFL